MSCPFLKEAQVQYCQTASVRKLIPLAQAGHTDERCSSTAHTDCPVYRAQTSGSGSAEASSCPYLCESLMQYCGAAAVTRFVPYSESLLSRCGQEGYRYCELYLGMAHPEPPLEEVDGMAMPERLRYSANHMWLDLSESGTCHAGIDAFLSRVLGRIDRITYVRQKGVQRPAAVVTVGDVDVELVFPNPFLLTSCNLYLRADPSRITAQPYTGGWLFEGVPAEDTAANLLQGADARRWMEREQRRMNEFLQQQEHVTADGGMFTNGVARHLDREQALALFHEFFSPYAREQA